MNAARWLTLLTAALTASGRVGWAVHRRGRARDAVSAVAPVRLPFNERPARWVPAVAVFGAIVVLIGMVSL